MNPRSRIKPLREMLPMGLGHHVEGVPMGHINDREPNPIEVAGRAPMRVMGNPSGLISEEVEAIDYAAKVRHKSGGQKIIGKGCEGRKRGKTDESRKTMRPKMPMNALKRAWCGQPLMKAAQSPFPVAADQKR